jgi:DNA-binding HxlR family transcriptional regulator
VEAAFELLSRKWMGMIVHSLLQGEKHFCDLERSLPNLSARVLSVRMKELEDEGLVARHVMIGPPVRVSYSLTDRGRALEPVMRSIAAWAQSSEPASQQ